MSSRHIFIFFLIVIAPCFTKAQYLWQVYPDTILKWNYYDGDEFNQPQLNTERWHLGFPWSHAVISQDTYFQDSNVIIRDGKVQFILKKEENLFPLYSWEIDTAAFKKNKIRLYEGNKYPFKYTSGLVWSNKHYQYGYFEIKFKAPAGQGIWPAFWLYGGSPNNEIDFFELKGENENGIHVDIHCRDGCSNYKEFLAYRKSWGHWIKSTGKLKEGFNVVAGEWTADYTKWYLNGELIAYSNQAFRLPMNLSAGTGIAKDGGPFKPGPNGATPFPNTFEVDYIRIYKSDTLPNFKAIQTNLSGKTDTLPYTLPGNFMCEKENKKLKNNKNKAIKNKKVITLSVMQLSASDLVFRALGVAPGDKIAINVFDGQMKPVKSLVLNSNSEIILPVSPKSNVTINADINGRVIHQTLLLQ